jgi:threonine dehydrogenase-like Zn-dependent dehydrogenase
MRAAVLVAPRRFELVDSPDPVPGPREVRVRVEGCGVCGSNLPVWQGRPWFRYPQPAGAPGHEAWGVVDAVGAAVAGLAVGDRVAGLSSRAFAELDLFSADAVVRLPPALAGQEVPGEPLACAMNIARRSQLAAGQTVAIIGIGFLGALLTRLASAAGARVIAISRRPYALEVAQRMGAWRTLPLGAPDLVDQVIALSGGDGCERVIEVVGNQEALDLAGKLARVRGRLVIAGFHQDGARQVDMFLWNWRGLDVVNAHERETAVYLDAMRAAIDALVGGVLEVRSLTTRVPLARIGEAFAGLEERQDGFLKGLVIARAPFAGRGSGARARSALGAAPATSPKKRRGKQ